ncbi:hypothetical protein [Deinococcus koreensis]|nr:hypothetical protein [Deinococcus koreensis]
MVSLSRLKNALSWPPRSVERPAPASVCRGLLTAAALLTSAASAQAAAPTGFKLPSGYMGRFGSSEVTVSNETGFGARYLPLPFDPDIRVSLVRQANYWEYNLSSRLNDTTLAGGVYFNGYAAVSGIPRVEWTRSPQRGLQYSALIQGNGPHSHLSGGYAFLVLEDRVRVLNTVGVALQGDVAAPYLQNEIGGGLSKTFGPVSTYTGATTRLYAFPVQGQVQGSVDLYLAANYSPVPALTLSASHFERFAAGSVAIPDFGVGRYEESAFTATYRLPATEQPVGLGALRTRVNRNWTSDYTYVRGDLLLDIKGLPSMVGPSIGYQFGPAGKDTRWLMSLVSLPR